MNQRKYFLLLLSLFVTTTFAQKISTITKDSLYEYEKRDSISNVIYIDCIRQINISDIDKFYENNYNLQVCKFKSLTPEDYAHLLILYDKKYLIVNMRKPLDEVISEVFGFLLCSNIPKINTEIWTIIIQAHYANRYVDIYERPRYWSYEPLKSTVK